MHPAKPFIFIGAATIFVLLTPFLFVAIPPVTDLPQHLGQVTLVGEALGGQSETLAVNWLAPNNLVYVILGLASGLFEPSLAARAAMAILVAFWVAAIFLLAWAHRRPVEGAVLASIFAYNMAFYWGFVNFMIGWPVFVVWLLYAERDLTLRNGVIMGVLSLLLYASHAMWFAAAMLSLPINALVARQPWKSALLRAVPAVPVLILALAWFPTIRTTRAIAGADTAAHWYTPPWLRFDPSYIVDGMWGGVRGGLEPFVAIVVLIWLILGVTTNRRDFRSLLDRRFLAWGVLFAVVMLIGPNKFVNTILFSKRWLPCAFVFLLLALPPPRGRGLARGAVVLAVILVFSVATARAWRSFDRVELTGLAAALETLPVEQRVLGLDFVKASAFIKGRPFLQIFAYAQVFKDADLNFSFAEHGSGIVRHRTPRPYPWTPGMTWAPERATHDDFAHFDYVLINGLPDLHERLSTVDVIAPMTGAGRWRLYRSLARPPGS